jgi:hypothetical protein
MTKEWYNLDDFIYVLRNNGSKSKRYHHFCVICGKDRGYAYKNKIMKEPHCHKCAMRQKETLDKIKDRPYTSLTKEVKEKISNGLYKKYGTNSIQNKIKRNLRSRLNKAIKNKHKMGSAVVDLGCSIEELYKHLESKFQPGMTWKNYGKWQIDHIKPLCRFDLTDRKQLKIACHYTNLQPLWAKDNLEKRKYDGTI